VLRLICGGTTHNRAIAVRLTITEFTVETHVKRIMVKLSASNRAEIIIRAYAQGLA
jgi:DNA-binding NarL/FixJ family response regulator